MLQSEQNWHFSKAGIVIFFSIVYASIMVCPFCWMEDVSDPEPHFNDRQ
jgi:hypothetical protein